MKHHKLGLAAATAALLAAGPAAHATIISSSTNNPLAFSWSQTVLGSDSLSHTLTGNGSMTLSGFNSSTLTVNLTLNNTSSIVGQGGERLTSFGFGIEPNATAVGFSDATDGGMIAAALGQTFPSIQAIEVCAIGGKNCAGGSNGGIFAGSGDTFSVLLSGTWGNSVNIDPIGFKYQTGYGSFEFTTGGGGGTPVPEPMSTALVGLGLAVFGLGFLRRRKAPAPRA